ncbi:MAG: Nif3-like dinuclear metal center hexameric protein [Planctomycetes bacterium]|nr:Nif3-like dinuclear metal center hexameric protein [Planctomycetota bacterium]
MSSARGRTAKHRRKPAGGATPPTVGEVYAALDAFAPFARAADWDNVGLLAGRMEWPARRVLLAIDLTDAVAREALAGSADIVLLYHPPIFKGIRAVTPDARGPTGLLPDLLAARVALIAVHTALDEAVGGTNDIVLDVFEPVRRWPLEPSREDGRQYKLVVFVPTAEVDALREALSGAGAGHIGHYSECSFELAGRGTFRGDDSTQPTIGRKQRLEHVAEVRLEMVVPEPRLGPVVRALYERHSYEEPAFDLYPTRTLAGRGQVGGGRVGELRRPQRGQALIRKLRGHMDLTGATVVGNLKGSFRSVTVAAGAFGVRGLCDPASLVLTGEFKHHDALELLRRGVTAVHLGHFASERPVLEVLRQRLVAGVKGVQATLARADRTPYQPLPA